MTDERLLIHALADGELTGEEKAAAERLVAEKPECRAEYEAVRSVKSVLTDKLQPVGDVAESWRRCRGRLDEIDRAKRVESFVTRHAWSFCAVFLVIILSAAMLNRTLGRNSVRAGDVSQMTSGLLPSAMPEASNPAAVRRWVSNVVGDVPMNFQPSRVQIVGGAAGTWDGRRVMRLTLRDPDGLFSLIVVSDAQTVDGFDRLDSGREYEAGRIGHLNAVAWNDRNYALIVVGDRPVEGLCAIAETIAIR